MTQQFGSWVVCVHREGCSRTPTAVLSGDSAILGAAQMCSQRNPGGPSVEYYTATKKNKQHLYTLTREDFRFTVASESQDAERYSEL